MPRNLVIVEFQEEVEYLLEHRPEVFRGDVKVLSLLPEASVLLAGKNIAFETSVNYFSKSSHEKCLKSVDSMIHAVNTDFVLCDAHGIRHAYTNALTFYLRQYLSYVVSTIEIISNVLSEHPVDQIFVCRYRGNDLSQFGLFSKERILSDIVGILGGSIKVESPVLDVPRKTAPNYMRKLLRSLFCAVCFPLELALLKKPARHPLVYYSLKYRFDHIAKAFKEYDHYNLAPDVKVFTRLTDKSLGMDIHNIHISDIGLSVDSKFRNAWKESLVKFTDGCDKKGICSYRDYDFSALVLRKMEKGYGPQLAKLNRQISSLKKFLSALKPAAVLSHVARDFSYALGELAESMNIPSVLISHGSHVPPKNEYDCMEWFDHGKGLIHTDYRYHLLQSPWAVEHVRAMGYHGKYFPIEPLIFPKVDRTDKQKAQLKRFPQSEGKRIIMHAGTPKPRGSNRLYIYETLDEYIAYMSDLVEAARAIPDIFLVIRFRPYPYLSIQHLKALLPKGDHYVVATDGTFADYLKIADLMVSFSSTTIEEALINSIPVLQYDPSNRYVHIEGAGWQDKGFAHVDSVYYIGDRNHLSSGLQWILTNHLSATLVGDFFERHAFKPGEAMSVQEFIERMIRHDLPEPIRLEDKKHFDGVEIY